jgi:hypothetical protein
VAVVSLRGELDSLGACMLRDGGFTLAGPQQRPGRNTADWPVRAAAGPTDPAGAGYAGQRADIRERFPCTGADAAAAEVLVAAAMGEPGYPADDRIQVLAGLLAGHVSALSLPFNLRRPASRGIVDLVRRVAVT